MSDRDYLLALELHKRLNNDDSDVEEVDFKAPPVSKAPLKIKRSNPHSNFDEEFLNRTQNLVHPQWETLDPTPDIFTLFGAFDTKFFQGRLKCVSLEWSKRMYSCAGICYSRRNRYGQDVTIRLSLPLLKLRPRKDLVETMLHEMIHAYCFVLHIREGNGGHGPNFKKIMFSINKVAGTNITVYHTFHDEVEVYKQHWWRCNGSCQNRSPFFGYVKRTCNRAPGPNDQWWAAHQDACGGTFMKIKEPEKPKKETKSKAKDKDKMPAAGGDLRKFLIPTEKPLSSTSSKPTTSKVPQVNTLPNGSGGRFNGPIKANGGGTMVLNPKTKRPTTTVFPVKPPTNSIATAFPPTSYPGLSTDPFNTKTSSTPATRPQNSGNLVNVVGFRDLNSSGSGGGNAGSAISGGKTGAPPQSMLGRGYSLDSVSSAATVSGTPNRSPDGQIDRKHLREIWSKRFGGGGTDKTDSSASSKKPTPHSGDSKRRRISNDGPSSSSNYTSDRETEKSDDWCVVDNDVMVKSLPAEIITILSDSDNDDDEEVIVRPKIKSKKMTTDERQTMIKQEILDETIDLRDEDIVLIDDEYNEDDDEDAANISAAAELADTTVIDEFFGDDTLMADFKRENDVTFSGARHVPNPGNDIITCPVCQQKMKRSDFSNHLDGCTGIAVKILPPKHALKKLAATSRELKPTRRSAASQKTSKDILREAGYSEEDIARLSTLERTIDSSQSTVNDETTFSSPEPLLNSTQYNQLNPSEDDENTRRYRQRNIYKTTRQCPVCAQEVEEELMNDHLDDCLMQRRK